MSTLHLTRESVSNSFYKYGLFIVFFALVLVFSLFNHNFFSGANASNLLRQTASTGIAAAGLVFVLVSGGITGSAISSVCESRLMCRKSELCSALNGTMTLPNTDPLMRSAYVASERLSGPCRREAWQSARLQERSKIIWTSWRYGPP